MAQKYRTAKQIILAIFLVIFSFIIIAAFMDSWKTGLIWLLAAMFLLIILRSYNNSFSNKTLSRNAKSALLFMFLLCFGWGITYLPTYPENKKNETYSENKKKEKEVLIENPIKISNKKNSENKIDISKLNIIQNKWASSIIEDWNGSYIKAYKLSENSDIIYFELTEVATKGNWKIDAEIHESIFQKKIDSLLRISYSEVTVIPKTKIVIIPNEIQSKVNSNKNKRNEMIARQFSLWNGANRSLQNYIKENMNDPDCYDHISTNYSDKGDYILVQTKIRGCNTFGAKIIQVITAEIDLNGKILSIN